MKQMLCAIVLLLAGITVVCAQNQLAQPAAKTTVPAKPRASTNAPIEITSEWFKLDIPNGVTVFTNRVKAWDDEMELFAEKMMVRFVNTTNAAKAVTRSVAMIIAEKDVVIVNKKDKSRAVADRAEYQATTDIIELTGNALVETAGVFSTADLVTYDRASGSLIGKGNVKLTIEPKLMGRTNLFKVAQPAPPRRQPSNPPADKKANDK